MIFPLEIQHTIHLFHSESSERAEMITDLIVEEFKKLKIDEFERNLHVTRFKNHFFNDQGRNHIFAIIDGGSIECLPDKVVLRFSTKRGTLIVLIMTSFMGLVAGPEIGLGAFMWLYGMNIIIFYIRSSLLVNRLKDKIAIL
jgi:hypothetical protein